MPEKTYEMDIDQFSRHCFYVCLGIGFFLFLAEIVVQYGNINFVNRIPECSLHKICGFYCFGCGGTRACYYLLKGHFLYSFFYHPFVLYMAAGYTVFVCSHFLHYLSGKKIRAMRFCPVFFYIGIAIIMLQFVLKNAALCRGFDYLKWLDEMVKF